jgi:hypothetical protein
MNGMNGMNELRVIRSRESREGLCDNEGNTSCALTHPALHGARQAWGAGESRHNTLGFNGHARLELRGWRDHAVVVALLNLHAGVQGRRPGAYSAA